MEDKDLHEKVKRLNALMPEYDPWRWTRARKEHQDLFGRKVQPYQYYFKRQSGPGWHEVIKLSRESMELLLYALFDGNPNLRQMADRINEIRLERLCEEHARCSPVDRLFDKV